MIVRRVIKLRKESGKFEKQEDRMYVQAVLPDGSLNPDVPRPWESGMVY